MQEWQQSRGRPRRCALSRILVAPPAAPDLPTPQAESRANTAEAAAAAARKRVGELEAELSAAAEARAGSEAQVVALSATVSRTKASLLQGSEEVLIAKQTVAAQTTKCAELEQRLRRTEAALEKEAASSGRVLFFAAVGMIVVSIVLGLVFIKS